jgi:hypothetical protein
MLATGLWLWYININYQKTGHYTSSFYLKEYVSETGFCLRLQAEPTQVGPIESVSLSLRTPATIHVGSVVGVRRQTLELSIQATWVFSA